MGSGKSKLGKQLAPKLGLPFIDLDKEIEKGEQTTIPVIFKTSGEAHFRLLEHQYLHALSSRRPHLVSLGGGTPCSDSNIQYIKKHGYSVYLKVPIPMLVSRLQKKQQDRPLLQGQNPVAYKQFLEDQLQKREAYYLQADIHVQNDGSLNANQLARLIQQRLA